LTFASIKDIVRHGISSHSLTSRHLAAGMIIPAV
jgi:hypothetical protein